MRAAGSLALRVRIADWMSTAHATALTTLPGYGPNTRTVMQIKDAHSADGSVTVAGDGDGQLVETIRALREDGFDGFFSLEPHLGDVHALGGFSGPELFTRAHTAFTGLLKNEGIQYA